MRMSTPCDLASTSNITKRSSGFHETFLFPPTNWSLSSPLLAPSPHQLDQGGCCPFMPSKASYFQSEPFTWMTSACHPHQQHWLRFPSLYLQPDLAPKLHSCAPSYPLMPAASLSEASQTLPVQNQTDFLQSPCQLLFLHVCCSIKTYLKDPLKRTNSMMLTQSQTVSKTSSLCICCYNSLESPLCHHPPTRLLTL